MSVRVEFYGIVRQRAGVESVDVEAATLGEALEQVGARLPELARHCLDKGHLRPGYLANVNGDRFTADLGTPLCAGDSVLVLSVDAGG